MISFGPNPGFAHRASCLFEFNREVRTRSLFSGKNIKSHPRRYPYFACQFLRRNFHFLNSIDRLSNYQVGLCGCQEINFHYASFRKRFFLTSRKHSPIIHSTLNSPAARHPSTDRAANLPDATIWSGAEGWTEKGTSIMWTVEWTCKHCGESHVSTIKECESELWCEDCDHWQEI